MNALLIYPECPETFWSFRHALSLIRKKSAQPPLGLLTVAAMLPEDWSLRLVDLNVAELTEEDLEWAECALVSGMIVQRESAHRVIARCKNAGLTVIAGGPLFTCEHELFENVDHFVLNEAEVTLPLFLSDLERGRARRVYQSDAFADLRESPAPRWGLVDLRQYASMGVQFSRGCPYDCEFCNVTQLFGHRWRTKTAAQVIAELDALYALGWRGMVPFVDDNLNANRRRLRGELLPALEKWRRNRRGVSFSAQVTIDLADDEELMRMMVRAGFDTVFIGIETLDDANLAECNKRQNRNRDLLEDVKRIQRAGLEVQGGFIVGFDHDTPSVFERLSEFIQKSGIATAMVGLLQAPVGTDLYKRLKKEGRIRDLVSGDNADGTTNIIPRMGLSSLQEGYRKLLVDLYSPRNYYRRMRTFLREYRPRGNGPGIEGSHIWAFFRSLYYLSMVGRERFRYPSLLLWTLLTRPRALPTAFVLAVYGYHFRKCYEPMGAFDERGIPDRRA
ncbi:MAG: DUF4070 domain-containing protein [Candidatus Eisenbacteria bacterium]|nr:DUF4070 domain-containing protein [Candidatus Eisenbacteria bacterium]